MRFESLAINGIGPFRRRVSIDLSAIPGLLVAVTGGNGQGKSTLLECLGGALYRTTPTRGSLADLAVDRNASIEARVVNGKSWTIRHTVDAISGKGEATVKDEDGNMAFASAKVRDFDAWAAEHLPSPEVLYSSSFAPQGSGGFLEMKAGERKAVLLRVLGIEALEGKAERARERARAAKQALDVLTARIADERQRGGDVAAAEAQLFDALGKANVAEGVLVTVKFELEEAQRRAQEAEQERARYDAAKAEAARLHAEIDALLAKRVDLTTKIANNQKVLADADAIRAAVARAAEIDRDVAKLKVDEAELEQKRLAHGREADATARRCNEASRAMAEAEQRQRRAVARLTDKAAIDKATAELRGARATDEEDEHSLQLLQGEVDKASLAGLGLAENRILELRPFVARIANNEIPLQDIGDAACDVIAEDDRLVNEAANAPAEVKRLKGELVSLREDVAKRRTRLRELESLAARASEIAGAKADAEEAGAAVERHRAELSEADDANKAARAGQIELGRQLIELRHRIDQLGQERASVQPIADKAGPLANAEARLAELWPQLEAVEAEQREKGMALAGIDLAASPPAVTDLRPIRERVERAEQDARHAHGMIEVAKARLESARLTQRKLADLEGQRGAAESDLADWQLLADSLGKSGLQALEVDAAGPELSALANDLLHTCVSTRWTVELETARRSSDGKKDIEGCDIRVVDTERGREASAETLSGGERVIVGEAISLALSMVACRRAGVEGCTLIRDESGAALDPNNAAAYIAMLRRAAEIVGASKVLFVSHSEAVQEMADARIVVRDGEVHVAA
jgi:DNA repair protein SbcC/Rad50